MPLISADATWPLIAIILVGTGLSIWLEQTFRWASKVSGPVIALGLAMTLTNLGIVPAQATAYDFVSEYLVPLAVPLLLLRADVVAIVRKSRGLLGAFHLSAVGTVLGAFAATLALGRQVPQVASVAGVMTGSYIGGSVNFAAVKESLELDENLATPLIVADNFIMAGVFIALLFAAGSRFFLRHFKHPHSLPETSSSGSLSGRFWSRKEVALLDVAQAFAWAAAIVAMATATSQWIGGWELGTLGPLLANRYIWITTLSVLAASLMPRQLQRIQGTDEFGAYMLYVYLFTVGLPADLQRVLFEVPWLFAFCLVIAAVNLGFTLLAGWLLGLELEALLLAVNATLGGAPSAAAMAISKGWQTLVFPALLVGVWGYAIGTAAGVATAIVLSYWWG